MSKSAKKIKPPKGTRDLYPEDVLRQRYITNAWRDASIRCGFEEIAGPTFESTDLYAVKSGDGILGELFQAFSGKSEREIEKVKSTGQAEYALRPEFTPTLARMYAAKSKELPKPCKWFTAGPYFRAERPQRGRLREFLQWNVDVIGLPGEEATPESKAQMDSEIIGCCLSAFGNLGLKSEGVTQDLSLHINDRNAAASGLMSIGIHPSKIDAAFEIIDRLEKIGKREPEREIEMLGQEILSFFTMWNGATEALNGDQNTSSFKPYLEAQKAVDALAAQSELTTPIFNTAYFGSLLLLLKQLDLHGYGRQSCFDAGIVRGLAYYTGTVFEALADGERAVAGGGRYDNLIELFGGPPTPACGFGMGDVVLSNLLDDKALMPEGLELMEAVARPQASIRPEAFVVPNGDENNESLVHTLTANLRRGIESESWLADENRKPWNADRYAVAPLHARISYKSTRKTNKPRDDAMKQHAKFFVVINAQDNAELTNLDTRETIGTFSTDPSEENYIGRAIADHL